jgi:hypothetical protein
LFPGQNRITQLKERFLSPAVFKNSQALQNGIQRNHIVRRG